MLKIAVLMDDINDITPYKDTTFALMLAAQQRGHEIMFFTQEDWQVRDGIVQSFVCTLQLYDNNEDYYTICNEEVIDLSEVDVVLQRKDPPFDLNFIYDSYMLDLLVSQGVHVINPPTALRDINEKFIISRVTQCTPETLISKSREDICAFVQEFGDAVIKPLDSMGGNGIFRLTFGDKNLNAILDAVNPDGLQTLMVQRYLPQIEQGDKRILLIDGVPIDHGLVRLAAEGEFRANLAMGGRGVVEPLTERELWLCNQIKPLIKKHNLYFVGLDVIGGYITEINVTSPTCMREIENATGQDIGARFWQGVEDFLRRDSNY